jgi:hypothetical protein
MTQRDRTKLRQGTDCRQVRIPPAPLAAAPLVKMDKSAEEASRELTAKKIAKSVRDDLKMFRRFKFST